MADEQKAEGQKATAGKQGHERSPNYPYIPLARAVERAQEFLRKEKNAKSVVPPHIAADHWGYSQKSSGGKQTIGALRAFGLLDKVGDGVRLSERARKLLLMDEREHVTERRALLKEAALAPAIHQRLWDRYQAELPSDASLRYVLRTEFGFSEQAVTDFIQEYRDTLAYAGLNDPAIIEKEEEVAESRPRAFAVGEHVDWESQGILQNAQPLRIRALSEDGSYAFVDGSNSGIPVSQLTRVEPPPENPMNPGIQMSNPPALAGTLPTGGFKQDVFSLIEGDVTFRWPEGLTKESFPDLQDWLEVIQKKIARAVGAEFKK